ncbi:MAG: DNA polymerase III subunit chi [Alphaproteobacteria bacterium]|nr:DNA polymerase III subunit chi [Alphaproteobacteria bacterium]
MTEVSFYHLRTRPLEWALPRLLEKILERGARAVVMTGSDERVEWLSQQLWTYDPGSFLPHGSARDGDAPDQPVWLTAADENPNGARFLLLTDGAVSGAVGTYERCFEIFDGNDEAAVGVARQRWAQYKSAGHSVTYWKQNERGGWDKS